MDIFQLPIYIYAGIKEGIIRLGLSNDKNNIGVILSLFITMISTPMAISCWIILAVYRHFVDLYLSYRYSDDYRGLMNGIDSICCNQENCVPTISVFVEFKGTVEELRQAVLKNIEKLMATQHEKMFYARSEFMGYHYYYKVESIASDFIVVMEDDGEGPLTVQKFSEKSIPYHKAPLPFNDAMLFQVIICPQTVILKSEPNNNNIYSLGYRIHHCVGDGKSILHYFKCVVSDSENVIVKTPEMPPKISITKEIERANSFINNVRIKEFPMMSKDENILRGYRLTEEKFIAWFSDSSTQYMDKIRKLRKSIKGVTFLDVINTCLVSSLYDYYKKYTTVIPKSIIGGVVLTPEIACFAYGNSNFNLKNSFSAASFNMPIDVESDNNNKLLTRLKMLQGEYNTVKASFDVQFNYFFGKNVINLIPSQVARFMARFLQITIGISSLPGCERITLFGGNPVKEFILMPPNSPGTGLHIIIYTYGGHLRIGLTVDRGVIRRYEEAQEIVDGMIHYLDELSDLCDEIKL